VCLFVTGPSVLQQITFFAGACFSLGGGPHSQDSVSTHMTAAFKDCQPRSSLKSAASAADAGGVLELSSVLREASFGLGQVISVDCSYGAALACLAT